MITIKKIILREINMKLVEPFQTSSGSIDNKRILLIEMKTDTHSAWSECVAKQIPNYTPETIDTCWLMIEKYLAPKLLNNPIDHPKDVFNRLETNIRGNLMAKAALEMGTWGLYATITNQSLSNVIKGTRKQVETGVSIGIQKDPEALLKKVDESVKLGYGKIKIKIQPGNDFPFIDIVRQKYPSIKLMVDANNAYALSDDFSKFDSYNLMMLEQPLAWDDVYQHAHLQKQLKTPICLDESITSLSKAKEMIDLKAGQIINIKPGRVGGFTPSLDIHNICQENNIPVWCGGMLETGIGRAYNIALASLPNFSIPGDLSPSARYWKKDIVNPEWTMSDDGLMTVPSKPGLGVDVDVEKIDAITVKKLDLT